MECREYDMAFGLGFSCGASFALRAAGLQFASYPLDWVGSPGLLTSVKLIAGGFSGWFEKEDLRLVDVRRGPLNTHIYRNERTGFGFAHDFSSFTGFDEAYTAARRKYDRRIARFLETAGRARRLLAVYIEHPAKGRLPDRELEEARMVLAARFPQAAVDILYFHEGGAAETVDEEPVPGVTVVRTGYRETMRGVLMHTIDISRIAVYLRSSVSVPDVRSVAEKKAFEDVKRTDRRRKWGNGGALSRFLNRISYRLYRSLEARLTEQGLLPWEGPLWFDKPGSE